MTNYLDELNRLQFSAEEKEAMVQNLATAEHRCARRGLPYRGLVAAAAAVSLLLGAAGATSLAGVSPAFREFFGITTSSQEAQLSAEHPNLTFMDQNGSGAAITVNEIVCDQETVYVLMDFTAPEGTGLLSPERTEDGRDYWLGGREGDMNAVFFADAACTQRVNPRSWSSGFFAVEDPDPEDQVIPLLLQVTADTALPAEAEYLQVDHLSSLWVCQGGAPMEVMKDLDFSLVIPLETTAKIYSFNGRCGVNLGGATPAVVENLTISPVAVTMDLVIRDSEVYDAALASTGPWQMYVLLKDGSRVETRFETSSGILDWFRDTNETLYFRADHVRFQLVSPIDPEEIADIIFVGDNSMAYDVSTENDSHILFHFSPTFFRNETFWQNQESSSSR